MSSIANSANNGSGLTFPGFLVAVCHQPEGDAGPEAAPAAQERGAGVFGTLGVFGTGGGGGGGGAGFGAAIGLALRALARAVIGLLMPERIFTKLLFDSMISFWTERMRD